LPLTQGRELKLDAPFKTAILAESLPLTQGRELKWVFNVNEKWLRSVAPHAGA